MDELLKTYYTNRLTKGIAKDTVDRVVDNTRVFCRDMRIKYPDQITTALAIKWGEGKLMLGIKTSTLSTYYNSLRAFLAYLDEQKIEHNADPAQIKCKAIYGRRIWLTNTQIRRIVRFADPPIDTLIRLLFMTGMRISEAVSITRAHLRDGDNTIFIKGKNGTMRPVFVDPEMHALLWDLSGDDGWCFHDPYGIPLDRRSGYYYIKKAMILAGFPKAYPHAIRHSFCTDLLKNGADLSHVSRLMGHKSVAITQIYTHLITEDIQKTHRKFLSKI